MMPGTPALQFVATFQAPSLELVQWVVPGVEIDDDGGDVPLLAADGNVGTKL